MSSERPTTPTLVTLHGESPGKVYSLDREVTLIGRDLNCHVILSRKFVSRKHARIIRGAEGYDVEDTKSNCGTYLDGERIGGRMPLKDGHRIKIGNYLFIFKSPEVMVTEGDSSSSTIIGVLDVASSSDATGESVHPRERLHHVLEISRKLGESLRLEDVLEKTLESLFKIFPQADRGFVLLKAGGTVDLNPRAIKYRGSEKGNPTISRTILNHVLNEGKAILSSDTATDRRFDQSQSIFGTIRIMICVPLLGPDREVGGILQLDTRDDRRKFSEDDLNLMVAVASQVSVAVENARLHAELIERMQIEQESQDAQEVQLALLPEKRPELPGYAFWDFYEPARYVGGDYFDYLPVAHADSQGHVTRRRWMLAVADVAGKGMPAALLMARLSTEVRLFTLTMSEPAQIVERLNRDFCHRAISERFITFLLVVVDPESHVITVVSAGHAGPIIRRFDGSLELMDESQSGPPLGVTEGAIYAASSARLEPGDQVLLYTDGLIDAMDAAGRSFGIERLRQTFQCVPSGARNAGEGIIRAVRQHAAACPQNDDITLLCFERLAQESS